MLNVNLMQLANLVTFACLAINSVFFMSLHNNKNLSSLSTANPLLLLKLIFIAFLCNITNTVPFS